MYIFVHFYQGIFALSKYIFLWECRRGITKFGPAHHQIYDLKAKKTAKYCQRHSSVTPTDVQPIRSTRKGSSKQRIQIFPPPLEDHPVSIETPGFPLTTNDLNGSRGPLRGLLVTCRLSLWQRDKWWGSFCSSESEDDPRLSGGDSDWPSRRFLQGLRFRGCGILKTGWSGWNRIKEVLEGFSGWVYKYCVWVCPCVEVESRVAGEERFFLAYS